MSGECYTAKNMHKELNTLKKGNNELKANINSQRDSNRREEVEQLTKCEIKDSSVEVGCNEMKTQINSLKQFYTVQTGIANPKFGKKLRSVTESFGSTNTAITKPIKKIRQNSQAIGTDTTGAPLGTLNQILAGITKPVHMSDFLRTKQEFAEIINFSRTKIDCQEQLHGVEEVKINSKSNQLLCIKSKTKFKSVKRSRSKATTVSSSTTLKKLKNRAKKRLPDKRYHRSSDIELNKIVPPLVTKQSKRIIPKHNLRNRNALKYVPPPRSMASGRNPDLVEIYHNTAVKETKSSESDIAKKKLPKIERALTNVELVPPLTIIEPEDNFEQAKGTVSCIYRNYATPTIASRMKQAAKYYMNSFNIKTIPFCLSTSTSPSHNIGINIQQVMSMVKSKQPVGRLSPTLAYNIGLAAGKREDNLLPFLVSTVASKHFYSQQCPLNKLNYNYQQLQEIAKNVPQEIIEEGEENEEINSPETQSVIITGPSGDVKVKNRKQTIWTANSDEKKCTCVTPKGLEFQQIINKFNGTASKNKSLNLISTMDYKKINQKIMEHVGGGEEKNKPLTESAPLHHKEKKLKEVLKRLHDEFEKMTRTYDDLANKTAKGSASDTTTKALETLDKELNSKEEEIVMVMSLYKEVLALKDQVKTLKERTSKENISIKAQSSKFNSINNSTTAGLLNQLLQRVHHFQTHYKKH